VLLFLLISVASLAVSVRPRESLRELRTIIFEPILFYFLVITSATDRRQITRLAQALMLGGLAIALVGLYQYAVNQNIITVNNEDDVVSVFDAWIAVPDFLKSERADHYVLGLEGNVLPALSTNFQTYYKYYGSLVTYNRDKIDSQDPDYVNSKGESYGFESLIRYGIPLVDLYGSYTLGWTGINANGLRYPPRYDRRHTLNLLANVHINPSIDLSLRWELGSGFPYTQTVGYYDRLTMEDVFSGKYVGESGEPYSLLGEKNASRLPAYHRLDASLSYRFMYEGFRGTLGFHVLNVYDRKNLFYFDRTTGKRTNMLAFFPSATLTMEF